MTRTEVLLGEEQKGREGESVHSLNSLFIHVFLFFRRASQRVLLFPSVILFLSLSRYKHRGEKKERRED